MFLIFEIVMVANIRGKYMYVPDELLAIGISKRPIGFSYYEKLLKEYPYNFVNGEIVYVGVEDLPEEYRVEHNIGVE